RWPRDLDSADPGGERSLERPTGQAPARPAPVGGEGRGDSACSQNYFIGSSSKLIIENIIRSQAKLNADPSLVKLFEVAQSNTSANIFINHQQSGNLFSKILSDPLAKKLTQLNDWTSFDTKITQDYIKLNGVSLNSTDGNHTLDIIKNTTPSSSEGADIVPVNADYFIAINSADAGLVENKNTSDSLFNNSRELLKIGINDQQIFAVSTLDNLHFEDHLQRYVKDQG